MSHLAQGFQGLWHLMTFPEAAPLVSIASATLAEVAKSPGELSVAIIAGTKAYHELMHAVPDMLPEDRRAIPAIFQQPLAELKTMADELTLAVNGTPGTPADPSKEDAAHKAQKAYRVAHAAVNTVLAVA